MARTLRSARSSRPTPAAQTKSKSRSGTKTTMPRATRMHRSFRRTDRPKLATRPISLKGRHLLPASLSILWHHKWLFAKTTGLYFLLLLAFAWERLSEESSVWLLVLLVVMSCAQIWLVRRISSGEKPKLKQALYQGTAQIIPFSLLFLLILIQLMPLAFGMYLFLVVVVNGIAVHLWEQALFAGIWLLLSLLSLYWLITSSLAIYIVTLPELTPMTAWYTARNLVEGRRFGVALRYLPLLVFVVLSGYLLLLVTPENWALSYNVFWVIVALLLPLIYTYGYKLYRALAQ